MIFSTTNKLEASLECEAVSNSESPACVSALLSPRFSLGRNDCFSGGSFPFPSSLEEARPMFSP